MNKKQALLALGIIVVVAAFLRAWGLGEVPFGRDEFLDINATVGYAQTGEWQAWNHNMGTVSTRINPDSDGRAWVYRWQVAQLFEFLPPTEAVARSVSVAWGIITTILVYIVATILTRRREIGLISAVVFALSINAIEVDRTLRMYAMFAPVFLAFATAVFLALERRPRDTIGKFAHRFTGVHLWYGLLALALGALSIHLHLLTVNIAFVVALYLVVMAVVAKDASKSWLGNKYAIWLSLMIGIGVIVLLFFPHVIAQFTGGMKFFENHYGYFGIILSDFTHPLIGLTLIVGGVIALARTGRVKESVWLGSMIGVIVLAAVFLWNRVVGPQYIFFIVPFISIAIGSGAYFFARYLATQLYGRYVFVIVLGVALIFVPNYGYFFTENNTYQITSRADAPNYRKVFTYVKKHTIDGDVLVTRNFRNYYWSGAQIPTYDFGSERPEEVLQKEGKVAKITQEHIAQIVSENKSGWVVFADNDEKFITKEARAWIAENLDKVSHSSLRGKITVYRWK